MVDNLKILPHIEANQIESSEYFKNNIMCMD